MQASAIPELPTPTTTVRSRVSPDSHGGECQLPQYKSTKQSEKGIRGGTSGGRGGWGKPELTTTAGAGRERRRSPPLRAAMGDAAAATAAEVGEWQSGMGGVRGDGAATRQWLGFNPVD